MVEIILAVCPLFKSLSALEQAITTSNIFILVLITFLFASYLWLPKIKDRKF